MAVPSIHVTKSIVKNNLTGSKDVTIRLEDGSTVGPIAEHKESHAISGNIVGIRINADGKYSGDWHLSAPGTPKEGSAISVQLTHDILAIEYDNINGGITSLGLSTGKETKRPKIPDDVSSVEDKAKVYDAYSAVVSKRFESRKLTAGNTISQSFSIGPLRVSVSFDKTKLQGTISASVIGISLGSASFSPSRPARLRVNVWLAEASVDISIVNKCLTLKASAESRFDGKATFGPKCILKI